MHDKYNSAPIDTHSSYSIGVWCVVWFEDMFYKIYCDYDMVAFLVVPTPIIVHQYSLHLIITTQQTADSNKDGGETFALCVYSCRIGYQRVVNILGRPPSLIKPITLICSLHRLISVMFPNNVVVLNICTYADVYKL